VRRLLEVQATVRLHPATYGEALSAMAEGAHRHLCGSPPSCGRRWVTCREARIDGEEIRAMLRSLEAAGMLVIKRPT